MSLEKTNYHFGNHPVFGNITDTETLITIQTWRWSIDWNYDYNIKIPKNYWHSMSLILRFGGGNLGHSSWYLECKRYEDGKEIESGNYGEMHVDQAIKCIRELDLKSIGTYDNYDGLKNVLKVALTTDDYKKQSIENKNNLF